MGKTARWSLIGLKALIVLLFIFDALTKLMHEPHTVDAFAKQGLDSGAMTIIGALLAVLIVIYVVRATAIFGAILLTGYLGGATSLNLRAGQPWFEILFPVFFGILVWMPVYLREDRLRALFPIRRSEV